MSTQMHIFNLSQCPSPTLLCRYRRPDVNVAVVAFAKQEIFPVHWRHRQEPEVDSLITTDC
jgi:hypothetical protein